MISVWVGIGVRLGVGNSVIASVTEAMVCVGKCVEIGVGVLAGEGVTASVTEAVICVGKVEADEMFAHATMPMDPNRNVTHLYMNRDCWMRRVFTN